MLGGALQPARDYELMRVVFGSVTLHFRVSVGERWQTLAQLPRELILGHILDASGSSFWVSF